MSDEFDLTLTNAERFLLLTIFEKQKVQIADYSAALTWKKTFDIIAGDWKWSDVLAAGVESVGSSTPAVLQFDPSKIDALSDLLYNVMSDNNLHNSLISKGLERSRCFSWAKAAQETESIYNQVLEGH